MSALLFRLFLAYTLSLVKGSKDLEVQRLLARAKACQEECCRIAVETKASIRMSWGVPNISETIARLERFRFKIFRTCSLEFRLISQRGDESGKAAVSRSLWPK